jgi:hypothetical protein
MEEKGWCKRLQNNEVHSLYSSPNIVRVFKSRRMRWVEHVTLTGDGRSFYRTLVERSESKSPVGRPRRRWEYDIKMGLRETRIDGENWIRLAQVRVQWWAFVSMIINLRVP